MFLKFLIGISGCRRGPYTSLVHICGYFYLYDIHGKEKKIMGRMCQTFCKSPLLGRPAICAIALHHVSGSFQEPSNFWILIWISVAPAPGSSLFPPARILSSHSVHLSKWFRASTQDLGVDPSEASSVWSP